MATEARFIALRQEQIGALAAGVAGPSLEAAIKAATEKTESDGEPRYIVQVLCHVAVDPRPRVIVTNFQPVAAS